MKPSSPPQYDPSSYPPPPSYSLPGQEPSAPSQIQSTNYGSPPPPGIRDPASTHQTIIMTVSPLQFGPYPVRVTCPNCNAYVMTETETTPGLLTYILSGALCLLACYICCLIPCCVRECKDIEHRCPNCRHEIGYFKRMWGPPKN